MSNDVVLIVDDSKFIAQAYSRVLLGLGYRVLIACDGKTGLFAAESTDIPVLIISSLSEKNGEKLIQEGAAGYFEKGSMTPEKPENAISGILKKRLLVP